MKNYNELSDKDKIQIYQTKYIEEGFSISEIANMYGTYPNRVRRDFIHLDLNIKTKSDVYKGLYERNVIKSPTEGRERTYEEKIKLSAGIKKAWDKMPEDKRRAIQEKHQKNWDKKSKDEKQEFIYSGIVAIRKTKDTGSKLERHVYDMLIDEGYACDRHVEHILDERKMHFDIFIQNLGVVIEIDGPSHKKDVWQSGKLNKVRTADAEKNRLVNSLGYKMIRISYLDKIYLHHLTRIKNELMEILQNLDQDIYRINIA